MEFSAKRRVDFLTTGLGGNELGAGDRKKMALKEGVRSLKKELSSKGGKGKTEIRKDLP